MVKIALDAGHGIHTAGKRTPAGEREWTFNNKVVLAITTELNKYANVQILRLDDPTGNNDVSLSARTNKANAWKADVLVSAHHNALAGKWGSHGGVETFVHPTGSRASYDIANIINPLIVSAMGLRNRGVKQKNLHMVRESRMPTILTEGGFMDSTTDIGALRSNAKLKAQGIAIAKGLAIHFKLKLKTVKPPTKPPVSKPSTAVLSLGSKGTAVGNLQRDLNKLGYKLAVDNSFGHGVDKALRSFQKAYGLAVDGYHGPLSQAKLAVAVKPKPTPKPTGLYKVQVGAFSVKPNAEALEKKLKAQGFATYITLEGKLYKVQCGAFGSKANAELLKKQLEAKGHKPFIAR